MILVVRPSIPNYNHIIAYGVGPSTNKRLRGGIIRGRMSARPQENVAKRSGSKSEVASQVELITMQMIDQHGNATPILEFRLTKVFPRDSKNFGVLFTNLSEVAADAPIFRARAPITNGRRCGLPPYAGLLRQRQCGRIAVAWKLPTAQRRVHHRQHVIGWRQSQARPKSEVAFVHVGIADEFAKPPDQRNS